MKNPALGATLVVALGQVVGAGLVRRSLTAAWIRRCRGEYVAENDVV